MRVTKKILREIKNSTLKRINELKKMSPDQLRADVKRMFPSMDFTGTDIELFGLVMYDLIDRAIPDHWTW